MKEQLKYQTMEDWMTKSFIWPLFNRVLHILLILFFTITYILGDIDELLDYHAVFGLSREIKEKLIRFKPLTLGQANRISGVTPVAIMILQVYLKKRKINPKRKSKDDGSPKLTINPKRKSKD